MTLRSLLAGLFPSRTTAVPAGPKGKPLYDQPFVAFTEFDRDALKELIARVRRRGMRALEVGSWLGNGSTRTFVEQLLPVSGVLYCVDTWRGSPNIERHQRIVRDYDVFATFMANIAAQNATGVVKPMMMTSRDAAEIVPDGYLDLVFIDGDHSYDAVREDIRAWLPKVRAGGMLCGHDCEIRASECDREILHANRHLDTIDGQGPFARIHPGPILAVEEVLGDSAVLLAATPRTLPNGESGHSSIWYCDKPRP